MRIKSRLVCGTLLTLGCTGLHAQAALPATLGACMKIVPDPDRLRCFDREATALSRAASPPVARADDQTRALFPPDAGAQTRSASQIAASTPDTATERLTPEQKLGLSENEVRRLEDQPGAPRRAAKQLQARVLQLSSNQQGRYVFVLDNGQVWHQSESKSSFSIRAGDLVTVSAGLVGSFWLSTGAHNSTRVQRVK